jgi:pantoate--beta-alanine ligase
MTTLVETIEALDQRLAPLHQQASTIGLVPTMGALHRGHAALIEQAKRECSEVVVNIFVNPLQFDRKEDLQRYPRMLESDVDLCRRLGVGLVFAPAVSLMYPDPPTVGISIGRLGNHLCGARRPGHFEGVATVVAKLFNIIRPRCAYFGEKDAQQLAIIRRMVMNLNAPVVVVGVPTLRAADGLALSSRNQHLSPSERQQAPILIQVLREAERLIRSGTTDPALVVRTALELVPPDRGLKVEYLEIVDPRELQPVEVVDDRVLVAGALWVGSTRLIDSVICGPAGTEV